MARHLVNRNLLPNPGFEITPIVNTEATNTAGRWIDGTAGGISALDSQYKWAIIAKTGAADAFFDSSQHNTGAYSLRLRTTATGSNVEVGVFPSSVIANTQRLGVKVDSNTAYIFTFWMKTNFVSGDSNDGAYIGVKERDDTATNVVTTNSTKVKTTTGWTQYSIPFTTSSTTKYAQPSLFMKGDSGAATLIMDVRFDDLSMTRTTPVSRGSAA